MNAGRELDALVAEKVMAIIPCDNWECVHYAADWWAMREPKCSHVCAPRVHWPRPYSTDIAAAWDAVAAVQRLHPGWRFCLLGGDVSMGYHGGAHGEVMRDRAGRLVVDEESRYPFGWDASFFGELDPRENYGDRHGEARAATAPLAICLAALAAVGVEVPA